MTNNLNNTIDSERRNDVERILRFRKLAQASSREAERTHDITERIVDDKRAVPLNASGAVSAPRS